MINVPHKLEVPLDPHTTLVGLPSGPLSHQVYDDDLDDLNPNCEDDDDFKEADDDFDDDFSDDFDDDDFDDDDDDFDDDDDDFDDDDFDDE